MGYQLRIGLRRFLTCVVLWLPLLSCAPQERAAVEAEEQPVTGAHFYVSLDGDDGWSGGLAAPNAERTDGPFATLKRARDALRELKAPLKGPRTVMVRGGKYFLDQPLVFDSSDRGNGQSPIIYRPYGNEKPILSGGRKLTGWKPYEGKIFWCRLPELERGAWKFVSSVSTTCQS